MHRDFDEGSPLANLYTRNALGVAGNTLTGTGVEYRAAFELSDLGLAYVSVLHPDMGGDPDAVDWRAALSPNAALQMCWGSSTWLPWGERFCTRPLPKVFSPTISARS